MHRHPHGHRESFCRSSCTTCTRIHMNISGPCRRSDTRLPRCPRLSSSHAMQTYSWTPTLRTQGSPSAGATAATLRCAVCGLFQQPSGGRWDSKGTPSCYLLCLLALHVCRCAPCRNNCSHFEVLEVGVLLGARSITRRVVLCSDLWHCMSAGATAATFRSAI